MLVAAATVGLLIGLTVGTVGGGGAVLAVPALIYLLDQSVGDATTTSLAVVAVASLAGGLAHAARGRVCWRHTVAFALPAVAGGALGTALNRGVDEDVLLLAFAPIMLLAAAASWQRGHATEPDPYEGSACPPLRLAVDGGAGLLIGVLTGFFGVGGGFVIVPTLAVALHFPLRSAIGTSLVIVGVIALTTLGSHLIAGASVDGALTATMAVACGAGAVGGAAVSARLPRQALASAFAVLVAAVAAWLVVSVVALGGP